MLQPPMPSTLPGMICYLAGCDDRPAPVRLVLGKIAQLARRELPGCDAASITYLGDGGFTTLAADPELVRAVDEAQYAEGDGPCLRAVRGGHLAGERLDASVHWPGFRGAAHRLGLRSVIAVPLFTAMGDPVASLNLWSRAAGGLRPLQAALVDLFGSYAALTDWAVPAGFDPGEAQLLEGVRVALELRMVIHRAVGYLAVQHHVRPEEAFQQLCSDARAAGVDVAHTARRLLPH
ncbi:MAG: GAF and ANTAR domain-containing protein [Frankiaceae bacterium]